MKADQEGESEISVLKEILKWTKFSGMKEVKGVINELVKGEQAQAIFQLSDGTRGTREVGAATGVGKDKVAGLWKTWTRAGLGETILVKGGGDRFRRSFDLEEFGIEIPKNTEAAGTPPEFPDIQPTKTERQEQLKIE